MIQLLINTTLSGSDYYSKLNILTYKYIAMTPRKTALNQCDTKPTDKSEQKTHTQSILSKNEYKTANNKTVFTPKHMLFSYTASSTTPKKREKRIMGPCGRTLDHPDEYISEEMEKKYKKQKIEPKKNLRDPKQPEKNSTGYSL